jgi:hypothetical protein
MSGIDSLVLIAEELSKDAFQWSILGHSLQSAEGDFSAEQRQTLVSALMYMYVESTDFERRERWGVYAPFLELENGHVAPPPLNSLTSEQLGWLNEVINKTKNPILLSRLNDVLWVRKYSGRSDLFARNAIDPYVELSHSEWPALFRAQCLIRAMEIGLELNDEDIPRRLSNEIVSAVNAELEGKELRPGVSLRLIEAIDRLPENLQPVQIDALLDKCITVYQARPEIIETIFELKAYRAKSLDSKKSFQLEQVNVLIREAKGARGLIKLVNLRRAAELARGYGFKEEVDQTLKAIQSIPEEEFDLKTLEVTTSVPTKEIEKAINWYFKGKNWQEFLERYGFRGPASGDYKKNLAETEKYKLNHPIQFLFSEFILDENNVPLKYLHTEKDHVSAQLIRQESLGIMIFGTLATEILDRFAQRYPKIDQEQITQFFTTKLIDNDIASHIAIAIDWYLKGEFDISAHLLLPIIERVFRLLAKAVELPIIRPPTGEVPGGVITLGVILDSLEGKFDESWRRYFLNLLTNPLGVNIRNRLLHGIAIEATKSEAALLIQAVCYLRLAKVENKKEKK